MLESPSSVLIVAFYSEDERDPSSSNLGQLSLFISSLLLESLLSTLRELSPRCAPGSLGITVESVRYTRGQPQPDNTWVTRTDFF